MVFFLLFYCINMDMKKSLTVLGDLLICLIRLVLLSLNSRLSLCKERLLYSIIFLDLKFTVDVYVHGPPDTDWPNIGHSFPTIGCGLPSRLMQ